MTLFGWGALMSPLLGALADHAGFAVLWPLCAVLAMGTVALTFGLTPDAPVGSRASARPGLSRPGRGI